MTEKDTATPTGPTGQKHTREMAAFWPFNTAVRQKQGFWVGSVSTLSITLLCTHVHLTLLALFFLLLLSASVGYWALSAQRLWACTQFLRPRIKNRPVSVLKRPPMSQALALAKRHLHRFCLSNGVVFSMAVLFAAAHSGDLSPPLWDLLFGLTLISIVLYVVTLGFMHVVLAKRLGHSLLPPSAHAPYCAQAELFCEYDAHGPSSHPHHAAPPKHDVYDPTNPSRPEYQADNWEDHTHEKAHAWDSFTHFDDHTYLWENGQDMRAHTIDIPIHGMDTSYDSGDLWKNTHGD